MKTCHKSLPNLFKAKESVHTDEINLEIPEINAVEIREFRKAHRTRQVKTTP